jgi:hypothetical protein
MSTTDEDQTVCASCGAIIEGAPAIAVEVQYAINTDVYDLDDGVDQYGERFINACETCTDGALPDPSVTISIN